MKNPPVPTQDPHSQNTPNVKKIRFSWVLDHEVPGGTAEIPFFIFLTVVMTWIGIWSMIDSPALRDPLPMISFGVLMLLHIALYWLIVFWDKSQQWVLVYLLTQGLLAFALNLIGHNLVLTYGLYMGLIGITAGLLGLTRRGGVAISFYLVLSVVNYGMTMGWDQIFWWLVAVAPMTIFVIIYVVLYNRQSVARTQAQTLAAELEVANRQLAEYAGQVEDLTLANERQRMARELHDTLSQGLAGLILQLEAADAHLASDHTARARTIVQQAMLQARATLADARRAIGDLRESQPLAALDPAECMRQEVDRFTTATGIPCALEIELTAVIPPAVCETLQRTLAEALTNIARHARAAHAQVRLAPTPTGIELTVTDDGAGFDPANAANQPGHYGLLGMRERARLAGGSLEITSQPASGTTLYLRLPV
jgi:NarL family two-component system sensor histidine kinase YdfH